MDDLRERSDAWRRLLQVLPDEIVIVDEHGLICHIGERIEVLTGYSRDELIGESMDGLVPNGLHDELCGNLVFDTLKFGADRLRWWTRELVCKRHQ